MKKLSIIASLLALMSCSKNKCVCNEKQSIHDEKIMNGTIASNTERIKYDFTIGEKVYDSNTKQWMNYTKEYIEQQKSELEATGEFDCTWEF
jgi:hypothetical protein